MNSTTNCENSDLLYTIIYFNLLIIIIVMVINSINLKIKKLQETILNLRIQNNLNLVL